MSPRTTRTASTRTLPDRKPTGNRAHPRPAGGTAMKSLSDLSDRKLSDLAYLDATRRAILEGFNAALVDFGRRYRVMIDNGRLLVGVDVRRDKGRWELSQQSQDGVQAVIAVDYSGGRPEFYVMRIPPGGSAGLIPAPGPESYDRWDLLK